MYSCLKDIRISSRLDGSIEALRKKEVENRTALNQDTRLPEISDHFEEIEERHDFTDLSVSPVKPETDISRELEWLEKWSKKEEENVKNHS